jgi:arylsulfatase A
MHKFLTAGLLATILLTSVAFARPNIILIMADDMGAEALASYGGTSYKTPELDAVAAEGMRFTHCYSQPICTPSRVKIMTGQSNARNYTRFGHLNPDAYTIGHLMRDAGYKTAVAGKWQLCGGDAHDGMLVTQAGFDEHCMWAYDHDLPGDAAETYTFFGEKPKKTSRYWNPAVVRNGEYVPTTEEDYGPKMYCDFILDFIDRHAEEPFFVYYPMALTHGPFLATPHSKDQSKPAKTKSQTRFFEDMIQYTGHNVQRILDKLEARGIAENTLVLFTCDNGTYRSIRSEQGDRVVHGGKGLTIDAGVHVPLVAVWKGVIEPGGVSHDIVDFSDMLPTLAALAGADLPDGLTLDGNSFAPRLRAETTPPARDRIVVHYDKDPEKEKPGFRRTRFAYDGRYKLYLDGRLFDVPNDWLERTPISDEQMTDDLRTRRTHLQKALDTLPAWQPDNTGLPEGSDKQLDSYRKHYPVTK